ncbi:MAG: TonB-dependent receptor [Novosphingobium sp. 17-62-19]|uniref:TonB-dependent receptor n=1 Tax=Novosphingobium sp. 17-62-19 TaxID=1970406 RepID=UPI000BD75B71|nr:TonB-dependent receptor [Novosphingobium sp. 17-62-19]OYX94809.1 MAG: TonB-dependent receptor [Novosphingobium sp. 35-62-5]OZA21812.1 MAG: TonB-dependent receptor [Novosphingobium sp. 17-62-19]HQS94951.1 TonB-dependent receptor [Novosphingobium sp.]
MSAGITMKSRWPRRCGAALLAGVAFGVVAMPQAAFAAQNAAPDQASEAEQPSSTEIIVTANRREERAQDVPISITAISAESIRERGLTQLQDLQASVPSLVVGPNGQASRDVMSPSIRGQSASFQGSPAVVVYMNEVPLLSSITLSGQGGPGTFVDLTNIQVLAGAQGTLFGRNTTGGAILLTPAKPTDALEGYAQAGFGNYGLVETEAVLNIPVSDRVRLRLVGASRDRNGFTYDTNWNKDRDDQHWRMARVGLWIEPVEGVTNYTLAYYGTSHSNGTGSIAKDFNTNYFIGLARRPVPIGGGVTVPLGAISPNFNFCGAGTGPADCSLYTNLIADQEKRGIRKTAHGLDSFAKLESWSISNTTDIELSSTLTLRNIFSYSELRSDYANDQDGTTVPIYDNGNTELSRTAPRDWYKQVTEELQVQGTGLNDKLTYTVGGFYFKQSPRGTMRYFSTNVCARPTLAGCGIGQSEIGITNESKALYAQGSLDFGAFSPSLDRLRLTAGYRYTWDTVGGTATAWNFTPLPGGGQFVSSCSWKSNPNPSQSIADPRNTCLFGAELKSSSPNWTIGLDYRPNDNIMVYGKATRGYKAGGFNTFAVFDSTRTFGPETVTDYELGFKSDFNAGGMRGRFNVNGFWLDYKNIQRAAGDFNRATGGNGAVTLNNASATIKGVEVEAMIQPTENIELGGNYSHLNAKYKSFVFDSSSGVWDCTAQSITSPKAFAGADMTCRPLQYLSPNIVSVYGRFSLPMADDVGKLSLLLSYNWTDAQPTAPFSTEFFPDGTVNEPGVLLPSYGLLNATIDWKGVLGSPVDLSLFATNITKKNYIISNTGIYQTIGAQSVIYGEPRMFGLRLRYSFGN